jgi:uncharacterized RDD family membrane protein YckC
MLALGLAGAWQGAAAGSPTTSALSLGAAGLGLTLMLAFFAVVVAYELAFERLIGATPGRLLAGTRVVGPDGHRPSTATLALRAVARALGAMTVLPALSALADHEPHAPWDRVAGTRVVARPTATPLSAWAPECDRALVRLAGSLVNLVITTGVPAVLSYGVSRALPGITSPGAEAGGPAALLGPQATPAGALTGVDPTAVIDLGLQQGELLLLGLGGVGLATAALALLPAAMATALEVAFEATGVGMPGRRLTHLRLMTLDGDAPGVGRLLLRTSLKYLLIGLPPVWLVPLLHPDRRALWDLAAGTRVG